MDIEKIAFNPLLGNTCGSIGSIEEYEKDQEKIRQDPRYPQWLEEANEKRHKQQEEHERLEREALDLLEKYASQSLVKPSDNLILYVWNMWASYEGRYLGIAARNIEEARSILAQAYKDNPEVAGGSNINFLAAMKTEPDIINLRDVGICFNYSYGE